MGTLPGSTTSLGIIFWTSFLASALVIVPSFYNPAMAQALAAQSATPNARYLPDSGYSQRREAQVTNTHHISKPNRDAGVNFISSKIQPRQTLPPLIANSSFSYSSPAPILIPTRPLYPQSAVAPIALRPVKPIIKPDTVAAAPVGFVLPIPDVNSQQPTAPIAVVQPQVQTVAAAEPLPESVVTFAAKAPKAPVATPPENQSLSDTEKEVEALRKEAEQLVAQAARKPEDAPTLSAAPPEIQSAQPTPTAPQTQVAQAALPVQNIIPSVRPEILPMPESLPNFKPYATIETQNKVPHTAPKSTAPVEQTKPVITQSAIAPTPPQDLIELEPAILTQPATDNAPNLLPLPDLTNAPPTALAKSDTDKKPLSLADVKISEPKKGISSASKKILHDLPAGVGSEKPERPSKLNIKRFDPAIEGILNAPVTSDDTVETSESGGVSIQVKSPAFNADYELEKAYNALVGGQSEQAKNIYLDILTQDPNNESALFGIASTFHRMNNSELARPFYGRLLKINPNHRDGLNNFLVLMSEEDPGEALLELQQLERRNPDFSPIPAQMAVIYSKSGNVEAARKQMIRAIQLAPENVAYQYNFAIMMDKQGDYVAAANMYRRLIEASERGQKLPTDVDEIQERLVYINSKIKH